MITLRSFLIGAALATAVSTVAAGQSTARDTLALADLQNAALRRDARDRQSALLADQSRLRLLSIASDRRPTIAVESQVQYQSDVTRIAAPPGGASFPSPPHDTYDARLVAQQRLFDPTIAPRLAVENAQLAASRAQIATSLYSLKQGVSDAFFATLRAQAQLAEIETSITDLEAQLQVAGSRVREGAALPSEELTIRAELLRRRQAIAEWGANRRAALDILIDLTGAKIDSVVVLAEPAVGAAVARGRTAIDGIRSRPEFDQFAATRHLLQEQEAARSAMDKPRVSVFGRVGYGKPGLNALNTSFDSYWLTGVQVQWSPWTWGASQRDRDVIALQRQIVSADEAAFTAGLRRAVAQDIASIDRLEAAIAMDDEIIELRERVLVETRARYRESVINSAEYVDRQTDVLAARVSRAVHRVELAQSRAHFLTTLGIEVR